MTNILTATEVDQRREAFYKSIAAQLDTPEKMQAFMSAAQRYINRQWDADAARYKRLNREPKP